MLRRLSWCWGLASCACQLPGTHIWHTSHQPHCQSPELVGPAPAAVLLRRGSAAAAVSSSAAMPPGQEVVLLHRPAFQDAQAINAIRAAGSNTCHEVQAPPVSRGRRSCSNDTMLQRLCNGQKATASVARDRCAFTGMLQMCIRLPRLAYADERMARRQLPSKCHKLCHL
jgi:hypothetical protein